MERRSAGAGMTDEAFHAFVGEVQQSQRDCQEGADPIGSARLLQLLWRKMQPVTQAEDGIADGSMLSVVRAALGRTW